MCIIQEIKPIIPDNHIFVITLSHCDVNLLPFICVTEKKFAIL